MDGAYTANIDGAARGNPGPASYGVVLRRPDGKPLESLGKYIGRHTNNVAEYYALIAALDYAAANGIKRLRVYSDSQLIVNQIKGLYKVKHPDLRPLHERAKKQAASPGSVHHSIYSARGKSRRRRRSPTPRSTIRAASSPRTVQPRTRIEIRCGSRSAKIRKPRQAGSLSGRLARRPALYLRRCT